MLSRILKITGVIIAIVAMTWVNLSCRGAEKLSQGEQLLQEKRERLAYETYAEVISMHYAPFSPQVRKAFDRIVDYGNQAEQKGQYEKALWAFALASNSFPPLMFTPYSDERKALKQRAQSLRGKISAAGASGSN